MNSKIIKNRLSWEEHGSWREILSQVTTAASFKDSVAKTHSLCLVFVQVLNKECKNYIFLY
jgi:hypothetical protein